MDCEGCKWGDFGMDINIIICNGCKCEELNGYMLFGERCLKAL